MAYAYFFSIFDAILPGQLPRPDDETKTKFDDRRAVRMSEDEARRKKREAAEAEEKRREEAAEAEEKRHKELLIARQSLKTDFETLEIPLESSLDEVKQAYKKMALKYHPDRNKEEGAEEKFKKINESYTKLTDTLS